MPSLANQITASDPLGLRARPFAWQVMFMLGGTLILALSSYIEVPMVPVPVTMQTFAVTMVGALYGWRLGAITIVAWLAQGAMGLPVLAGGAAGAYHFVGPTGGYLLAFPLAGALTGWLVEHGWTGRRIVLSFTAMLLGNAVCLLVGAAWLAMLIGMEAAIMNGVMPFLLGGALKSALGAAVLRLMVRGKGRSHGS